MAACSILSIQCADVRASAAFYDAVLAVAVLTERGVQGDRLAAVLLHLDDLLRGYVQLGRELPPGWARGPGPGASAAAPGASVLTASAMCAGIRMVRAWSVIQEPATRRGLQARNLHR